MKKENAVLRFTKRYLFNIFIGILLTLFSLVLIVLLVWALLTSFKGNMDFRANMLGLPEEWLFTNYTTVLKNFYVNVSKTVYEAGQSYMVQDKVTLFPELIYNTLVYSVGGAFVSTLCPCIMAYVVAKFDKWKISKVIYWTVVITMMIPLVGNAAASISVAQMTGVYDNLWGNLIQKFNFLGLYFLMFHGNYKMLAKDYSEAAYLDGASEWRVFFFIIFPLIRNIFGTIFLIKFIEFWNDYTTVLIYLPTHPTLAYGIYVMSTTNVSGLSTIPMRITGAMILFFPMMIIFAIFQKKLLGNLSMGGVKE